MTAHFSAALSVGRPKQKSDGALEKPRPDLRDLQARRRHGGKRRIGTGGQRHPSGIDRAPPGREGTQCA